MKKEPGKKEQSDIRVLARFVEVYCRSHHRDERTSFGFKAPGLDALLGTLQLCPDCAKLLRYGLTMRLRCPQEPKPMCKRCLDPCYKHGYREKIREVMKFSGMYLLKRGRIDLIYHYFW